MCVSSFNYVCITVPKKSVTKIFANERKTHTHIFTEKTKTLYPLHTLCITGGINIGFLAVKKQLRSSLTNQVRIKFLVYSPRWFINIKWTFLICVSSSVPPCDTVPPEKDINIYIWKTNSDSIKVYGSDRSLSWVRVSWNLPPTTSSQWQSV